jgi:predicted enzyme related to lactoylglutathione lyase
MKKRVTGIGGVFFKTEDPKKLKEWYGKHLGLPIDEYGASFKWIDPAHPDAKAPALTAWSPFKSDTTYFNPSDKPYMFNYRVENLVELLKILRQEGVEIVGEMQEFSYGKFGWIMDPDGNKIELWEPMDDGF